MSGGLLRRDANVIPLIPDEVVSDPPAEHLGDSGERWASLTAGLLLRVKVERSFNLLRHYSTETEVRFNLAGLFPLLRYHGAMSHVPLPSDRPLLRRDAERNRQRILAAARRLIAWRGLNVGYEEIAREADVGVGTVYRRFPTRDELFHELFQDRVDAVVEILEEALAVKDPWEGLCEFLRRDFELQAHDRGLREFILSGVGSTEQGRRSRERIQPLVTELVERAQAAGYLRSGIGESDIAIILTMIGGLMDASLHVDPDLWRRYLAMVLNGIRRDDRDEEIPGTPPAPPEVERILATWVAPRRSQG